MSSTYFLCVIIFLMRIEYRCKHKYLPQTELIGFKNAEFLRSIKAMYLLIYSDKVIIAWWEFVRRLKHFG